MTEKKQPAKKAAPAKKAPAKKAPAAKKPAAKKPAAPKPEPEKEIEPVLGVVAPLPEREHIELTPAPVQVTPVRAQAPAKKKGFFARLFRR